MNFNGTLSLMPPLHHTNPGEEFDIERSEVVAWIMSQPGFKQWVFDRAKATERIIYDGYANCWRGQPRGKPGRPMKTATPEIMEVE